MTGKLDGTFVVMVAEGEGATRAGRLADVLRDNGARAVVFTPDDDADVADENAIVEMVAELAAKREAQ
jgi:hypothetical protein